MGQRSINPIKELISLFQYYSIYKRNKFDVVLNFTPKPNIYSTIAASFCGIKVINNIAGLGHVFIGKNGLGEIILKLLYKISQRKANMIFFQNNNDLAIFNENKIALSVSKERIPGSGVDLNRFKYKKIPNGKVIFLLVARLLYSKGVKYYAEAAKIILREYHNEVEFRVLGFFDRENSDAIPESLIREWESEGVVTYLGSSDNVELEMAKVSCVVLPSYYREGVPKSLLEACALGRPIITTDNVGCRETVDDQLSGFLCEKHSVDSLVEKMRAFINMGYDDRVLMGLNGRLKVEAEFDENIIIDRYKQGIYRVLN